MFVDASAIVAILTREAEADALADTLDGARSPITSPIALFEAVLRICRKRHTSVAEAQQDVQEFLTTAGVRTVTMTVREAEVALDAFARYGKGRGHPAQLNLRNCFAYAAAKTYRTSLLFTGGRLPQNRRQICRGAARHIGWNATMRGGRLSSGLG